MVRADLNTTLQPKGAPFTRRCSQAVSFNSDGGQAVCKTVVAGTNSSKYHGFMAGTWCTGMAIAHGHSWDFELSQSASFPQELESQSSQQSNATSTSMLAGDNSQSSLVAS